jgi:hypothetical protein
LSESVLTGQRQPSHEAVVRLLGSSRNGCKALAATKTPAAAIGVKSPLHGRIIGA